MEHIVITGASTGIGRAAAQDLAAHGYHIFGSVRREADAAELQAQLDQAFTPLLFDVTDEVAVKAAAARTADLLAGQGLFGLVNNAGVGSGGPLLYQPLDEVRRVLEVNVLGALAVTQAFLPLLGAQFPQSHPPGRIVNITSVGGKIAPPFLGAYSASKFGLEGMSDSLRRELAIFGIDVIVVEPGPVKTAIWDKAEEDQFSGAYQKTIYGPILAKFGKNFIEHGRAGVAPEAVAALIRKALESAHPRARYVIHPRPILNWFLPRLMPDRWLDWIIVTGVGLRYRKEK